MQLFKAFGSKALFGAARFWPLHDPRQLFSVKRLLFAYSGLLRQQAFSLSFQKPAVICAVIAIELTAVQFKNGIADTVQKIAVMRYHEDCPAKSGQTLFQPFDGIAVQMVGRLIQNEQVAGRCQNRSDGKPLLLSAG